MRIGRGTAVHAVRFGDDGLVHEGDLRYGYVQGACGFTRSERRVVIVETRATCVPCVDEVARRTAAETLATPLPTLPGETVATLASAAPSLPPAAMTAEELLTRLVDDYAAAALRSAETYTASQRDLDRGRAALLYEAARIVYGFTDWESLAWLTAEIMRRMEQN